MLSCFCLLRPGVVECLVCFVWCGRCDVVKCSLFGVVWCGVVWCGWCSVVWCGVVGVVWFGMVRCGIVSNDVI